MKIYLLKSGISYLLFACILFYSCTEDSNEITNNPETLNETTRGSGYFEYSDYAPFNDKFIKIYYFIPTKVDSNSKFLFVFHGNGRNAEDYRDSMISKANQYNFIVIAPEFSSSYFPSGDSYNLGNVFIDGDNPSNSTLNPEEEWTFSVIDPLFDYIKQLTKNTSEKYEVFGHSAGGQFAHRFVMFKPHANYNKVVASGSGWYTVTNFNIRFPYGLIESPIETIELTNLFSKNLIILIGSLDNNTNAAGLRHNTFADAQGLNRLARAYHFFNTASVLAENRNLSFQWEFYINEGANHDFEIASQYAADLIFN
jgi:pimeloyl-ACP methyl ester carboxylesterase